MKERARVQFMFPSCSATKRGWGWGNDQDFTFSFSRSLNAEKSYPFQKDEFLSLLTFLVSERIFFSFSHETFGKIKIVDKKNPFVHNDLLKRIVKSHVFRARVTSADYELVMRHECTSLEVEKSRQRGWQISSHISWSWDFQAPPDISKWNTKIPRDMIHSAFATPSS